MNTLYSKAPTKPAGETVDPYGFYKFVILSIAKNLTSHNVNLTVCREQPLCCSEKTQQNFTGERSSPLRLVHSPLVFAKFNLARAGVNAYGSRVTTGLSKKKRREQAPALRILHLRLAYHTSMPSFFAARRVKSSRASRQNVKPKSAPIVTSVRKCLPIIMRVKPSSHV